MSQVGYYYWRGLPLTLLRSASGRYYVRGLPAGLRDAWRRDVLRGKVRLENP